MLEPPLLFFTVNNLSSSSRRRLSAKVPIIQIKTTDHINDFSLTINTTVPIMASKLQEYRDNLERNLRDKNMPWTKYFEKAELKTGVDRVYLFVGLVAFTGLYLVFGFGAGLICNLIGFVYPAYMSMKALESSSKDDDTKWLTYWVVYACFSCVEYFSDFIVGWFPLYWLVKCIFIIWCYLPTEYNGSLVLYNRVIRPYYQKHHLHIDEMANSASRAVADVINKKN